jgi:hypothetical protein
MTDRRRVLHLVLGDAGPPDVPAEDTVVRLEGEPDADRVLDLIAEHDVVVTW